MKRIDVVKHIYRAVPSPRTEAEQQQIVEGAAMYLATAFCVRHSLGQEAIEECTNAILQACDDFADEWTAEAN